jgi:hypothetical protein
MAIPGALEPGDSDHLQWDRPCGRLSPQAELRLTQGSGHNLSAITSSARPQPAVACGA